MLRLLALLVAIVAWGLFCQILTWLTGLSFYLDILFYFVGVGVIILSWLKAHEEEEGRQ